MQALAPGRQSASGKLSLPLSYIPPSSSFLKYHTTSLTALEEAADCGRAQRSAFFSDAAWGLLSICKGKHVVRDTDIFQLRPF